jgi:ABC-type Zn uptake system ZnuABC Zn-binding protein ZnuA
MKWKPLEPGTLLFLILLLTSGILPAQRPFKVVATASILSDMAKNIAGDAVEVATIVPIGGDPHIYEPTPSDAQLVASADLILKNGLTFEGWLDELIENSGTRARIVTVTEGIEPIKSSTYKNATDPHAWMDASNGMVYSANICKALTALDPANEKMYAFNLGIYRQQLELVDSFIFEKIKTIPEQRRILITSHDAFQYYGRRYGLKLESVLGTSTDAEVQTSDIMRLNQVIKSNGVPAVFIESTINPKLLEQLARDNHIEVGGKLYSDSIGDEQSPAPTYIDMLRHNTEVIAEALSRVPTKVPEPSNGSKSWLLYGLVALIFLGGIFYIFRRIGSDTR